MNGMLYMPLEHALHVFSQECDIAGFPVRLYIIWY